MTHHSAGAPLQDSIGEATFFGHPRGLATLFFTEMWERFSYYGMRALLVLFMTAPIAIANPGLGYGAAKAGAVYGLYTSMVYLLALPGGWVADNLWGQRRAVFVGGCISVRTSVLAIRSASATTCPSTSPLPFIRQTCRRN